MNITDPEIVQYLRNLAERKSDGQLKEMEEAAKKRVIPIIHKEASDVLLFFLRSERPGRILEIGTAIGYSAILMARESKAVLVDSIERDMAMVTEASANIQKFGLEDQIQILPGEADEILKDLVRRGDPYDLIFMDAGKSHYSEYLETALQLLSPGGLILCDNVLIRGLVALEEIPRKHATAILNMRRFIEEVSLDESLISTLISTGDGMLLIRKKKTF